MDDDENIRRNMKPINIARDYSDVPGPRYVHEGPHSGEDFRESILLPQFKAARQADEQLTIELDGARYGYPTSFLEEAFGGLARSVGIDVALAGLTFISVKSPLLVDEIEGYIRDAEKTGRQRRAAAR